MLIDLRKTLSKKKAFHPLESDEDILKGLMDDFLMDAEKYFPE